MATGVVLTTRNMAAEGRRAAGLDGAHRLELGVRKVALHSTTPSRAVVAEDIRDLQRWTRHFCRRLQRRALPGSERCQLIERACHIAQHLARHVRIARRRVELGMSQSHLDHANIDILLQKMRRERVPERVRRHALLDPTAAAVSRTTR